LKHADFCKDLSAMSCNRQHISIGYSTLKD
jgi:hypothetical protein